jgi:hypothetical protein
MLLLENGLMFCAPPELMIPVDRVESMFGFCILSRKSSIRASSNS